MEQARVAFSPRSIFVGGAVREQAGRLDILGHIGEHPLHALELG